MLNLPFTGNLDADLKILTFILKSIALSDLNRDIRSRDEEVDDDMNTEMGIKYFY